jgi:formylglycine-generating enzyme required for sulfatase activity
VKSVTLLLLVAACSTKEPIRPPPVDSPSSLATTAPPQPEAKPCPANMVLIEGNYCPNPLQICKRWLDPPGPYQDYRCGEYAEPATCRGDREPKRFCIDKEEYVVPGDASNLPLAHQSWTSAGEVCSSMGRRLCLESEWQFACEGEEMRPYPYGFKRDATACNIDQMDLGRPNAGLKDLRAAITDYPRCLSPFGVHDMSGNIEEWATLDHGAPPQRSTMKGAWWLPGKNTCRARTLGHGEVYAGSQVGVRCCAEAKAPDQVTGK